MKRLIPIFIAASLFATSLVAGTFAGTGRGVGSYRVELTESTGDPTEVVAQRLASTYGGRLELFAEAGFHGFAVTMSAQRARLLSADPAVASVVEIQTSASGANAPTTTIAAATPSAATTVAATAPAPAGAVTSTRPKTVTPNVAGTWTRAYTYDDSGNITSIGADTFVYDGVNRLKSSTVSGIVQTFTYDGFGNMTDMHTPVDAVCAHGVACGSSSSTIAVQSSTNRLSATGVTYAPDGSVAAMDGSTFTFDGAGMMTRSQTDVIRQFVYSVDDERIGTYSGGSWNWTLRDPSGAVLREFTSVDTIAIHMVNHVAHTETVLGYGDWAWNEDYIYRGAQLLAAEINDADQPTGVRRHFHLDHLGTPRLITDDAGHQIGVHSYLPFGAEIDSGTAEDPEDTRKFTGHERDGNTANALDYMHARFYRAGVGRFSSFDPGHPKLEKPQSWNAYVYALDNPVVLNDPDGKCPVQPCIGDYVALGYVAYQFGKLLDAAWQNTSLANQYYGTLQHDPARVRLGELQAAHEVLTVGLTAMTSPLAAEEEGATEVADGVPVAGSIRNVNPTGSMTNCVNCAATVDNLLATGRPASALPSGPKLITELGSDWKRFPSQESITATMTKAGDGARGIVYAGTGQPGVPGHVFNVVNQNGVVRYLDGQTEKAAQISADWVDFRLLRKN